MENPSLNRYRELARENDRRLREQYRYRVYVVKGVELHYRASYATPEDAVKMATIWANSEYLPHYTYTVIDSQSFRYIEPNEVR